MSYRDSFLGHHLEFLRGPPTKLLSHRNNMKITIFIQFWQKPGCADIFSSKSLFSPKYASYAILWHYFLAKVARTDPFPPPPRTTLTWTCPTMIFVHFTLALVHEICYTLLQEDGQHCSGGRGADWQTRMAVSYGAVSFLGKFLQIWYFHTILIPKQLSRGSPPIYRPPLLILCFIV